MLQNIITSKSKTFLAFCFCFIVGATTSSWLDDTYATAYIAGISCVVFGCVVAAWKFVRVRFVLLCIGMVCLGSLRLLSTIPEVSSHHIQGYTGQVLEIRGIIDQEPDERIDKVYNILAVSSVDTHAVVGRVLIKLPLYPKYEYGDELKLTCHLQNPEPIEDTTFRYDKYLAKQNIWMVCTSPKHIIKLSSGGGSVVVRIFIDMKQWVRKQVHLLWSEPHASFMAGMLYGEKQGFSPTLMNAFSKTGVTHIIAVSGFNISIIAFVLMNICVYMGLYQRQAFWFAIGGIVVFVVFSGCSASAVRAAIMGIIVLYAKKSGRSSVIGYTLVHTVTLMTLLNPYVVLWDVGFQLSFLATIGLVYIAPILKHIRAIKYLGNKYEKITENFIATVSAIIATLPLILFQFGTLSFVAPFVNVLVLWVIPWLMLFGFLSVVASVVYLPVGQMIAYIASIGMHYVVAVVEWFAALPFAAGDISIPWWIMVTCYVGMLQWTRVNRKKYSIYA